MSTQQATLSKARLNVHLAEADLRFSLHRMGNKLSEKHGYGSLSGIDAIARFLLERDGTPMYETLSMSAQAIHNQIDGVLEKGAGDFDKKKLTPNDEPAYRLMVAEAKLDHLLEFFGDELGQEHKLGVDGLNAVRLYLSRTHGFRLSWLEALRATELRKYLEKEMDGWTYDKKRHE